MNTLGPLDMVTGAFSYSGAAIARWKLALVGAYQLDFGQDVPAASRVDVLIGGQPAEIGTRLCCVDGARPVSGTLQR